MFFEHILCRLFFASLRYRKPLRYFPIAFYLLIADAASLCQPQIKRKYGIPQTVCEAGFSLCSLPPHLGLPYEQLRKNASFHPHGTTLKIFLLGRDSQAHPFFLNRL
jgi:hypothetical protein